MGVIHHFFGGGHTLIPIPIKKTTQPPRGFQALNGKPYVPPPPYGHSCLPATRMPWGQRRLKPLGYPGTLGNLQLTIPETHSSHLQIGHATPKADFHFPTMHFQGRTVSFREGNPSKEYVGQGISSYWTAVFYFFLVVLDLWFVFLEESVSLNTEDDIGSMHASDYDGQTNNSEVRSKTLRLFQHTFGTHP